MSMITAVSWVPRGHAAQFPTKYIFDDDEYARISKLAKLELDDAREDYEQAKAEADEDVGDGAVKPEATKKEDEEKDEDEDGDVELNDDDLKEYDLEHYDDEPDSDAAIEEGAAPQTLSMFGNIKSLAYHSSNAEDPYITIQDDADSDDDEREELEILPTDNLLLTAKIEDEMAHLEVYVYEDSADNLYVHHDIMLPAIPLAVEWINMPVNRKPSDATTAGPSKANFVAVGTLDPEIEIWDLDLIDSMYPNAVLGGTSQPGSAVPSKKKKKSKKPSATHHVDSVLSLASSRPHPHLLASASADTTIKLWDLHKLSCAHSYTHHTDKVSAVTWHPTQSTVLLSGSYDRTLAATDMRAPSTAPPRWRVDSDVEALAWDPRAEHAFYAGTESGVLHRFDTRDTSKPVWRLQAHEGSLGTFSVSPAVDGLVATGSADRQVKLWDVNAAAGPGLVVARDVGVGRVLAVQFAPDDAVGFRLAVAGGKGAVQVWDTSTNRGVRETFGGRVGGVGVADGARADRVVKVRADDDSDDDDEDERLQGGGGADGWESMDE